MSHRIRSTILIVSVALLASGCSAFWTTDATRSGVSSSLVDYLYPSGQTPPEVSSLVPNLELPLRVGIAFVPGSRGGQHPVPEAVRIEMLEWVKEEFVGERYVEKIEVIPETYLKQSAGIDGMRQVARLYGVDVMALVSYDQVTTTSENPAAFLYWTIVGAYVIPGTENQVHTFVDTAVLDVRTGQLLFRAPGVDQADAISTAAGNSEAVWATRNVSFSRAIEDMRANLRTELDGFESRVREGSAVATVSHRDGGGGATGWLLIMLLIGIVVGRLSHRYNPEDGGPKGDGTGLIILCLACLPLLGACGGNPAEADVPRESAPGDEPPTLPVPEGPITILTHTDREPTSGRTHSPGAGNAPTAHVAA